MSDGPVATTLLVVQLVGQTCLSERCLNCTVGSVHDSGYDGIFRILSSFLSDQTLIRLHYIM